MVALVDDVLVAIAFVVLAAAPCDSIGACTVACDKGDAAACADLGDLVAKAVVDHGHQVPVVQAYARGCAGGVERACVDEAKLSADIGPLRRLFALTEPLVFRAEPSWDAAVVIAEAVGRFRDDPEIAAFEARVAARCEQHIEMCGRFSNTLEGLVDDAQRWGVARCRAGDHRGCSAALGARAHGSRMKPAVVLIDPTARRELLGRFVELARANCPSCVELLHPEVDFAEDDAAAVDVLRCAARDAGGCANVAFRKDVAACEQTKTDRAACARVVAAAQSHSEAAEAAAYGCRAGDAEQCWRAAVLGSRDPFAPAVFRTQCAKKGVRCRLADRAPTKKQAVRQRQVGKLAVDVLEEGDGAVGDHDAIVLLHRIEGNDDVIAFATRPGDAEWLSWRDSRRGELVRRQQYGMVDYTELVDVVAVPPVCSPDAKPLDPARLGCFSRRPAATP